MFVIIRGKNAGKNNATTVSNELYPSINRISSQISLEKYVCGPLVKTGPCLYKSLVTAVNGAIEKK